MKCHLTQYGVLMSLFWDEMFAKWLSPESKG